MKLRKRKLIIIVTGLLSVLLVAFAEYYSGYDLRFSIIYVLPIILISWFVGRGWGIVFSVLSIVAWLTTDLMPPTPYSSIDAAYANAIVRLLLFVILSFSISQTKIAIELEKKIRIDLQKGYEEISEVNRELRSFTYSLVHDIKNPIIVVSSFCDILKESESKLEPEQNIILSKIISEVNRIKEIIDDMLRLSKIGSTELNLTKFNLSDVAAASVEELSGIYTKKKYEVNIQPEMIAYGDMRLIRILLDNLIGNAMKFTEKSDSPKIWIGVNKNDQQKKEYFVKDNGIGFDPAKSNKLFEPFVRLHSQKEFSGTGIGLAIVRKIVAKHYGKIWVSSEPGKGTTFYFTLSELNQ